MKHLHIALLILLVMTLALTAGCSKKPLITPSLNVTNFSAVTTSDVKKAIVEACTARGWKVDAVTDTWIDASITVRGKHYVAVHIPYSTQSVRIEYRDSSNMKYTTGETTKIHRNYNLWVNNLIHDINAKLTAISNLRISNNI